MGSFGGVEKKNGTPEKTVVAKPENTGIDKSDELAVAN